MTSTHHKGVEVQECLTELSQIPTAGRYLAELTRTNTADLILYEVNVAIGALIVWTDEIYIYNNSVSGQRPLTESVGAQCRRSLVVERISVSDDKNRPAEDFGRAAVFFFLSDHGKNLPNVARTAEGYV